MIQGFKEAKSLIDAARNILLVTHRDPDGDALGSVLAMKMGLAQMGKKAEIFCRPAISSVYDFLPGIEKIKTELAPPDLAEVDLVIGLDYGSYERTELNGRLENVNFLTIDHHLSGNHLGLRIIHDFSSVAEIIYHFLKFLDIPINLKIATCLLTGIYDDTGGFRHPNTKASTLEIAGRLLAKGAPLQKIAKLAKRAELASGLPVWDHIFSFLEIDPANGLIFSLIPHANVLALGLNLKISLSAIAGMLSAAPEARLALLLIERAPGIFEGSLRAQKNRGLNVAQIAEVFGGGGHPLAAGFRSAQKPEEIIRIIKKLLPKTISLKTR